MRATSVLYLDSLDYQRDLFPSVASTALARMASAFAHVRNISNNVAIVTSSAIHDKLNKRLIEKIFPQHQFLIDIIPANMSFYEACGAINVATNYEKYFVWKPVTPFLTANSIEHCIHNIVARNGKVSLLVREFDGYSDFHSGAVRLTRSGYWLENVLAFDSSFDFSENTFCTQLMDKRMRVPVQLIETLNVTNKTELDLIQSIADNSIGVDL
jgi:hypothetical protein